MSLIGSGTHVVGGVGGLFSAVVGGITPQFDFPSGFAGTSSLINVAWNASRVGAVIDLVNGGHSSGCAWYVTQQDIRAFTTTFTVQWNTNGFGMTFGIQNTTAANDPNAFGIFANADANLDDYGDFTSQAAAFGTSSLGLCFDCTQGNGNSKTVTNPPSAIGLFPNGGPYGALMPIYCLNANGFNLQSGNVMLCALVYDGTSLTMVLTDTTTGQQVRMAWLVNIPAVIGQNTAWVGFLGANPPSVTGSQNVITWKFGTGFNPVLAVPTISPAAGQYSSAQTVTLSGPAGASLYYTTNGQDPTSADTLYSGSFSVSAYTYVKAVAIQSGHSDSAVAASYFQIATGGTPVVNFPSGFTSSAGLVNLLGSAIHSGSEIYMTNSDFVSPDFTYPSQSAAAWFVAPVSIASFSTTFQMRWNPNGTRQQGMCFVVQNQNAPSPTGTHGWYSGGNNCLGPGGSTCGYGGNNGSFGQVCGIQNSVAVKFDVDSGTTGLFLNGADTAASGITITGANLLSTNPMNITLTYSGTTLALSIVDSVTSASFSHNFSVDIPGAVGSSTAFVGFTASTSSACVQQFINSWTGF